MVARVRAGTGGKIQDADALQGNGRQAAAGDGHRGSSANGSAAGRETAESTGNGTSRGRNTGVLAYVR